MLIIILIILVVAVAVFFLMTNTLKQQSSPAVLTPAPTISNLPTQSPSSSPAQTSNINIQNFSFDPTSMTVKVGTIVTWTNNDNVPHTVTSDESGGPLNSQTIQPGNSFTFTFNQAGTFPYYCTIHPNMKGKVIVI